MAGYFPVKVNNKLFLLITCLIIFSSVFAYPFEGPLQVKNQYPITLHVNQPYLETASPESSFSASLSHSSTYTVQNSSNWYFGLDMEITELNLRYKRNIKDLFEIGLDVPVLSFNSGFMDGFLSSYHSTFGFPDYGRSNRPLNEFLYEVRKDGNLIIKGETGTGLGDIRLTVKKPLISSKGGFGLSIQGAVELPTGNAKKGYGNGSLGANVSVIMDKGISDRIMTYWNLGYAAPGDVKGYQKIDLKNFVYGGAAVEADVGKKISILTQIQGQSPIYPKTDLLAVDRAAYLLSIGGRYHSGKGSFELSLSEDINTSGAPDFIVNLTYKMKL